MERIRLWHRDFHGNQIIYNTKKKQFYLIDFGLSNIEYMDDNFQGTYGYEYNPDHNFDRHNTEVADLVWYFAAVLRKNPNQECV